MTFNAINRKIRRLTCEETAILPVVEKRNTNRGTVKCKRILLAKHHLQHLEGRIIMKLMLKIELQRLYSSNTEWVVVAGCSDHVNRPLCSIKGNFF